jgi:hypothetical protein
MSGSAGAAEPSAAQPAKQPRLCWPLVFSLIGLPLALMLARLEVPWAADLRIRTTAGAINGYLGRDFVNTWTGAKLALADLQAYAQAVAKLFGMEFHPAVVWSYPPAFLLLVSPLGLLGYVAAFAAYMGVTGAAFLIAGTPSTKTPPRWLTAVALAVSPASIDTLVFGQNSYVASALLVGGMRLIRSSPVISGILLGGLVIKPQLGIVVPFALVAMHAWRALAAAATCALFLACASIFAFGVEAWEKFFSVTVPMQHSLLMRLDGPFATMLASAFYTFVQLGAGVTAALWLQSITAAAAIAAVALVCRRSSDPPLLILAVAAAQLLATPYVLQHDLTALTAALGLYLAARRDPGRAEFLLLMLGWMAAPLTRILDLAGLPFVPLIFGGLLALAVARALRRPQGDALAA